jgi:hypothetical protein
MSDTNGPDMKKIVNAGLNAWLSALPEDDWGDSFAKATPIHWDETSGQWVESEPSKTGDQE